MAEHGIENIPYETIAQEMLNRNSEIFTPLFVDNQLPSLMDPDMYKEAERILHESYPDYNLKDIYAQCMHSKLGDLNDLQRATHVGSLNCPRPIFDAAKRNYLRSDVLPPTKRRKKEPFDVYKFLMQKDDSQEGLRLSFDYDASEELFDFNYGDKSKREFMADQALRKIAKIVSVLKERCNYRVMDLHSERRIR